MALKQRNKVNAAFSMSSMTDIVFLLLIFFMVTSTLVAPNALKLMLPQSNNQTAAKAQATISITKDLKYYLNENGNNKRVSFREIEPTLVKQFGDSKEVFISLYTDESVDIGEVVKIMNIARKHDYKMILATQPSR